MLLDDGSGLQCLATHLENETDGREGEIHICNDGGLRRRKPAGRPVVSNMQILPASFTSFLPFCVYRAYVLGRLSAPLAVRKTHTDPGAHQSESGAAAEVKERASACTDSMNHRG